MAFLASAKTTDMLGVIHRRNEPKKHFMATTKTNRNRNSHSNSLNKYRKTHTLNPPATTAQATKTNQNKYCESICFVLSLSLPHFPTLFWVNNIAVYDS